MSCDGMFAKLRPVCSIAMRVVPLGEVYCLATGLGIFVLGLVSIALHFVFKEHLTSLGWDYLAVSPGPLFAYSDSDPGRDFTLTQPKHVY